MFLKHFILNDYTKNILRKWRISLLFLNDAFVIQKAETIHFHSREQITELTLNCTKNFISSKFIGCPGLRFENSLRKNYHKICQDFLDDLVFIKFMIISVASALKRLLTVVGLKTFLS